MDKVLSPLYRAFSNLQMFSLFKSHATKEENFGSGTANMEMNLYDAHCDFFRDRKASREIDKDLRRLKICCQWAVDLETKTLTVGAETASVAFRYALIITKLIDWRCSNAYKTDRNKKCLSTLLNKDFFEIDFLHHANHFLDANSIEVSPPIDQVYQDFVAITDVNERAFLRSEHGCRALQKIFRENNVLIFFKNEFYEHTSTSTGCILEGEIRVNGHQCKIRVFEGALEDQKADLAIDFFDEQSESGSLIKWLFLDDTQMIEPKIIYFQSGNVIPIIFPVQLSIDEHKRVAALQKKLLDVFREARKRPDVKTIALSLVDIFHCNIENATAAVVKSILDVLQEGDMPEIRLVDHRSQALLAFENVFKQIPKMQILTSGCENQHCGVPMFENGHKLPEGKKIYILPSDIVAAANTVDVVVNSTDTKLANTGASSKALIQATGKAVTDEIKSKYPRGIDKGDIAITGAGSLQCKNIIHVALPKWSDDSCLTALDSTIKKCLDAASELDASSIAFPVIGTGGLKYPVESTSRCMMRSVLDWLKNAKRTATVQTIQFVVRPEDETALEAFEKSLAAEYVSVMNKTNVRPSELTEKLSLEVGFIGKRANIDSAMGDMRTVLDQFLPVETFQDDRFKNLPFDKMKDLYDLARHSKVVMEYERGEGRLKIRGCHARQLVRHLKTPICFSDKNNLCDIPEFWQSKEGQTGYLLVDLQPSEDEYKEVEKAVRQTSPNVRIKKVQRVENVSLCKSYLIERDKGIAEKFLFHGTHSKNVPSICTQGFNWRLAGTNIGHIYGHGNYFSTQFSYSAQYAKDGQMFLAMVLVGESILGAPDTKIPPLKPGSAVDQYESTVNDTKNPSIYVVFYDSRAYPAYLITFKRNSVP